MNNKYKYSPPGPTTTQAHKKKSVDVYLSEALQTIDLNC